MKKALALILACMMSLSIFAGCNNSSSSSTESSASGTTSTDASSEGGDSAEAEQMDVRVVSATTSGTVIYEKIDELCQNYMAEHPNVTITFEGLSSGELRTKLSVEFAAGSQPDVSWIPASYAREYTKSGQIIDWAPVIEEDAELKSYFSDVMWNNASNEDGQIMFCPSELSFDSLYYNKEIFEANGWTPPETWTEFIALCDEINAAGLSPLVNGGADSRFAWLASALLSRTGGLDNFKALTVGDAMTSWNDPAYGFVEAMEKFKEMVDHNAYYPGCMGMTATEADEVFARGEAVMYYEGAWKPANFEAAGGAEFIAKLGRVDFPIMEDCPDGDTNNVGGAIVGYYVSSGLSEAKEDVCIELVKNIASPEFNVEIVETGTYLYAGECDYDESKVSDIMNECIKAAHEATDFIASMDAIAAPAIDLAIKGTAMPGLLTGEYTVDEAVAEVQKAAEDYVASLQ